MGGRPTITSLRNPRVNAALRLRRGRGRDRQGRVLIDGVRELQRAVEGGVELIEVFGCPDWWSGEPARRAFDRAAAAGAAQWRVSPAVMAKLAFGGRREGLVAVARAPRRRLADAALPDEALVLVLEGVEKPGNVGAIVRTADAAGAAAVLVADAPTDPYAPAAIRASLGAVFTLPVVETTSEEAIAWLRGAGAAMFAAVVDAPQTCYETAFPARSALVLGGEAHGLSRRWRRAPIVPIRLPMLGAVDSLNVAAAAAALAYEVVRQRRFR